MKHAFGKFIDSGVFPPLAGKPVAVRIYRDRHGAPAMLPMLLGLLVEP